MKLPLTAALALSATAAFAQPKSDWERENEERLRHSEEVVVAPPKVDRAALVELQLEARPAFATSSMPVL